MCLEGPVTHTVTTFCTCIFNFRMGKIIIENTMQWSVFQPWLSKTTFGLKFYACINGVLPLSFYDCIVEINLCLVPLVQAEHIHRYLWYTKFLPSKATQMSYSFKICLLCLSCQQRPFRLPHINQSPINRKMIVTTVLWITFCNKSSLSNS